MSRNVSMWMPAVYVYVACFRLDYFYIIYGEYLVVLLWFQNVSCRSVSVGFAEKTSVFGLV